MQKLENRFKYLRGTEFMVAFVMPIVLVIYWRTSAVSINWLMGISALILMSYLLIQGAIYWHFKLRALTQAAKLPSFFGLLFGMFKKSNVILFGLFIFALLWQVSADGWSMNFAWPIGIFVFAVCEHVNYYYYQLMYDTSGSVHYVVRNRRLRRAALGVDLKRFLSTSTDATRTQ